MENLILYLYNKHVNSKDIYATTFARLEAVKVYSLKPEQLQFYKSMIIRNFFIYSAANMEIKLSVKHLFGIYRLHQFQSIAKKAGVSNLFKQWMQNQMMPFNIKNVRLVPNNCPYVYVDFSHQAIKQQTKNIEKQQPEVKKGKTKQKNPKVKEGQQIEMQEKQKTQNGKVMINILQLSNELQNQILSQQLGASAQELKNQQKRVQIIQKFIKIKIDEYINQRYNKQSLMTYNFIQKYPFIDEKDLLNRTMLPVVQLRKCLCLLLSEGLIMYYPENQKTMLYKSTGWELLKQKYRDHIAQSILNLHIYMNRLDESDQQKQYIVLKSIQNLDHILMILMA